MFIFVYSVRGMEITEMIWSIFFFIVFVIVRLKAFRLWKRERAPFFRVFLTKNVNICLYCRYKIF